MPRPPAKRGRVARQKAAAQPVQPTPLAKRRIEDIDDSSDAQNAKSANNSTALHDSRTRKHETPRTSTVTGTRGQQFASAIRRAGDASSKIQKIGTPGFDSSMLSNFRPRPRQPSILHLMDDDNDDDEENSSDLDSEAFLGSFDPEDESTPLNFSRRKTLPVEDLPPSPSPMKKVVERSQSQSQESNRSSLGSAKRRRVIAVEVPGTQPDEYPTLTSDQTAAADAAAENENEEHVEETDAERDLDDDDDDDDDEIPLPEPLDRQTSPEILSQTMVPPMSSSVAGSPVKSPNKASHSTPSQTRRTSAKQARISTATLRENLLPVRRRRRPQRQRAGMGAFDVPSEEDEGDAGLATDEDELSYLPSNGRKGSRKALRSNKQGANKKIERTIRSAKEKITSKPAQATKTRLSRTYSRRSQDKENDVDEDASDAPEDAAEIERSLPIQSEELLKAKLKFEEVDRWQMDFEDVVVEQSSPYR